MKNSDEEKRCRVRLTSRRKNDNVFAILSLGSKFKMIFYGEDFNYSHSHDLRVILLLKFGAFRWNISFDVEHLKSEVVFKQGLVMFEKRHYVIGVIVSYVFLFMLFFVVKKEERSLHSICHWSSPCFRFCGKNSRTCNESFIRENFNESYKSEYGYDYNDGSDEKNLITKYTILFGTPKCSSQHLLANNPGDEWAFKMVKDLDKIIQIHF